MTTLRGARPAACLLLIALATATQISLAPLLAGGADSVDVPLILLLWFAGVDRWSRVVAIGGVIVISRLIGGASAPLPVILPLAAATLWMRFARHGVDPRDPGRRIALVAIALVVASLVQRLHHASPWNGAIDSWATGVLLGTVAALLLFPVLDLTTPLVRSADYPM